MKYHVKYVERKKQKTFWSNGGFAHLILYSICEIYMFSGKILRLTFGNGEQILLTASKG